MKKIPSYIRDTNNFLFKLNEMQDLPSKCLLVTLDVTALYTNIPHEEGMEACREALNTRDAPGPPIDDVVHPIALIVKRTTYPLTERTTYKNMEQ